MGYFFIWVISYNESYKRVNVSKVVIFSYLQIIFVIVLSFIFLGEPFFLSDLLGMSLIIGYLIYDRLNPLPVK